MPPNAPRKGAAISEDRQRARRDGPIWLLPDGEPGRYRIAASVDHGTSAIVDEPPAGGADLWLGYTSHLKAR